MVPNLVPDASALDNCTATAAIAVTQDIAPNTVLSGPATTQTVTLTADDGNGNTVTCTVALTLQDETPPVITCPVNQDFTLDASCEGVLPDFSSQLAATDNCTPMGSLAVTQSPLAGTMVSGANTIIPVTFTVDDNNGNTENCTFQVTLADETPPTVNCPVDQVLSPDADCMAIIPNYTGLATPSDACTMSGLITLTQSPGAGTILTGDNQMATVTITADDGNGNTANCTFSVTTADNTPPTIGCPDNQDVAVDANCAFNVPDYTANATLHDNCSENVDITVTQSPLATTLTALNTPATITLTATDQAGNAANCTFTVTPLDQTDPDIVCPSPQVIYYDAACSVDLPDFTAAGTPADNCSAANVITVTQSPVINTTYTNLMPPLVTVTLTAEDESGNTNSCDFTVNLRDTIAPILTCPNDTIIALDVDCNGELPDLTDRVQATENCSPNSLTVLQSPDPGSVFSGDGTEVEVTFTVIDSDGNQSTCITTVTFEDMSPPNPVTCPTNQTLTTDDVCPIALPDFTPNATVIDNCRAQDEIILTQSPTPDTMIMGNGTVVPVTITADDGNGNTANCTFTVSLVDNVPVNLACPGGQIVIASSDNCDAELPDFSGDATVTNECMSPAAGVTFTQAPTAGTIIQSSQLDLPQTVTLTAQDINGNLANCTFTVTMIDTLAPMLTCPSDDVRSVDASCQHLIRNYLNSVTVADNCSAAGDISLQQTPAEGTLLPGPDNSQEITVTATDESGNLATCTFNVTIQDVAPPNVQCPAPDTLFVNAACEATIPDYTSQAVILDNCTAIGDMTVNQTPAA
ncbi:MAG: HYR domain-containing protein, partial [Bacteroidota bacterium]